MFDNYEGVRESFKLFAKELIWFFLADHVPSDVKDIFLYASRRSGSTLLMEVLACNKGMSYSDQPFGLHTITPWNLNLLPLAEYSQLIHLDKDEELLVENYVKGLLGGRIYANAPWRFWRYGLTIKTNRIVLKITDAKSIIEWLDGKFNPYTVVMTRHPIPQSLSVIRNGWDCTGKAFIRNDFFIKKYLNDDRLKFCNNIYKKGTKLQRHVLDWSLENMIMINKLKENNHWIYVSYERLVSSPDYVVNMLSKSLQLDDVDAMLDSLNKPSKSSKLKSNIGKTKKLCKQDKIDLLGKWKDKVSESEERSAMDILFELGIGLYKFGEFYPSMDSFEQPMVSLEK